MILPGDKVLYGTREVTVLGRENGHVLIPGWWGQKPHKVKDTDVTPVGAPELQKDEVR